MLSICKLRHELEVGGLVVCSSEPACADVLADHGAAADYEEPIRSVGVQLTLHSRGGIAARHFSCHRSTESHTPAFELKSS